MTSCHSIYLHLGSITRHPTAGLCRYGLVYTNGSLLAAFAAIVYEAGCSLSEARALSYSASGLH